MSQTPPKAEKDKSERWLLTYADLITLLCIFFVVMYVMSLQDVKKFEQVASSLRVAFKGGGRSFVGDAPGVSIIPGRQGFHRRFSTARQDEKSKMESIKKKIEELAKREGLQSTISVTQEERGVVITIVDQLLFRSGYAALTPQAYQVLQGVGKILSVNKDQYLRVEGHTDNVPMSSAQFTSNWELSANRATNVLKMFISDVGIDPRLLSAVGYGEFRPIAENSTQQGRIKNRRVEIVVLDSKFSKSESQGNGAHLDAVIGESREPLSQERSMEEGSAGAEENASSGFEHSSEELSGSEGSH